MADSVNTSIISTRSSIRTAMRSQRISTPMAFKPQYYPVALPFLAAYARLGRRTEEFPNAFRQQGRILSLPMFPEISPEQQHKVVQLIREF
jgi:dTDP-4-amino-4,6-dideoxygalactose transaminase